jgi:hypothetical protein
MVEEVQILVAKALVEAVDRVFGAESSRKAQRQKFWGDHIGW